MPSGQQRIRGHVKPRPHQAITVHQIPKAERDQRPTGTSFWQDAPRDGFTQQAEDIFGARYRVAVIKKQTAELRRPQERICEREGCDKRFAVHMRRPDGKYCSPFCGKKAWKQRKAVA